MARHETHTRNFHRDKHDVLAMCPRDRRPQPFLGKWIIIFRHPFNGRNRPERLFLAVTTSPMIRGARVREFTALAMERPWSCRRRNKRSDVTALPRLGSCMMVKTHRGHALLTRIKFYIQMKNRHLVEIFSFPPEANRGTSSPQNRPRRNFPSRG